MDPAMIEESEAAPRIAWWRKPAVLGAVVFLLVISSLLSIRTPSPGGSAESERLSLEVALMAREAYATSRNPLFAGEVPMMNKRRADLLKNFQRLADLTRSPEAYRRLALLQHALKVPHWSSTLSKLRTTPSSDSFIIERELARWKALLGTEPIPPSRVIEFERWIRSLNLGWYRHLAYESLYRKTGQAVKADLAMESAEAPWNRMILLFLAAGLLILGGLILGAMAIAYLSWARKNPSAPKPWLLRLHSPPPLNAAQGETLYMVFLVYLVSHAVMQLGVGRLLGSVLRSRLADMPDYAIQGISVAITLIWLAIPLYALVRLAPRAQINLESIGLRSRNFFVDVLWGIGGWMVALPLVLIVSLLAAFVFRGVDTPAHPAVMELASSKHIVTISLLLFQASVLAPVSEELMFRGVFFRSLTPRMRWIPAVTIASSVFAILHPQLPLGFFALFTLGAVFNVLYALRGSLIPAITAHALNNTAVLIGVLMMFRD